MLNTIYCGVLDSYINFRIRDRRRFIRESDNGNYVEIPCHAGGDTPGEMRNRHILKNISED